MKLLFNYLVCILVFVVIYLLEKVILLWTKKKPLLPIVGWSLLVDAIAYTVLSFLLIGVIHLVFKKIDAFGLVWLDVAIYFLIKLINPSAIYFAIKKKESVQFNNRHVLGAGFLAAILLECLLFNQQAYSDNKSTVQYTNFVCDDIFTDGYIEGDKITLTNKQCIYINTKNKNYDNIYLGFDNNDVDLYINIFEMKDPSLDEFVFKKYVLIDPKYDAFGYISLDNMQDVHSIKIEFDIDDSRYLNHDSKPAIVVNKIEFDSYFPMIINPVRLGGCLLALVFCFNFKKLFIDNKVNE